MSRALCLLHANCQGEALCRILEATPAFAARFHIRYYANYQQECPTDAELAQCALLLYQPLGEHWGTLASACLLQKLPPHAQAVPLPNLFFKGCWPFWTHSTVINFQDSLLEKLRENASDDAMIQHVYLHGRLAEQADLDGIAEESLQQAGLREQEIPIKTAGVIRADWRERQLFFTINHPAPVLLELVADALLALLGLGTAARDYALPDYYTTFHLPVHPQVARHFHLRWAPEGKRYPAFGRMVSCAEYVSAYLTCRRRGIDALPEMLTAAGLPPA